MRHERFWGIALVIAGCTSSASHGGSSSIQPTPETPRQPVASAFGKAENGEIKKQARFELAGPVTYGWKLKLPCTGPTLFRETLQLPAPGDWSDLDTKAIRLSADRTRSVLTDYAGCFDGWIEHGWTITERDPPGEYVLTVEVDGFAAQTFRATFVAPAP